MSRFKTTRKYIFVYLPTQNIYYSRLDPIAFRNTDMMHRGTHPIHRSGWICPRVESTPSEEGGLPLMGGCHNIDIILSCLPYKVDSGLPMESRLRPALLFVFLYSHTFTGGGGKKRQMVTSKNAINKCKKSKNGGKWLKFQGKNAIHSRHKQTKRRAET